MSLANQLTLIRLVAVVPVMVALYLPFEWARPVAVVLYVAAILTDYFDGIIARRNNEVTGFGKLMDSIADKALIVSLFFALVGEGSMAAWMAAIMVIREFAVTGLRMVALEAGEVIAANRWGKAKMNAQSLAVFILLLGKPGAAGCAYHTLGLVLFEGHPAYPVYYLQARSEALKPVESRPIWRAAMTGA